MRRESLITFAAKLPDCVVEMEACGSVHHMGHTFVMQGHEVWLMLPEYVRPYVKGQKKHDRGVEVIAEAVTWPNMRLVELKCNADAVQGVHATRSLDYGTCSHDHIPMSWSWRSPLS